MYYIRDATLGEDASGVRKGAAPEVMAVLRNVNLSLLGELAVRYDVATRPEGPEDPPSISCPEDVRKLLGLEMSGLAQEQLRVLLLNTKNLGAPRNAA